MTRLGWMLDDQDLPGAELCAARLDGELFALDRAYVPVDLPESPMQRAGTLLGAAGSHLIAERMSAAWIHGARTWPPARHQFCVDHRRRVYLAAAGILAREVVLAGGDVVNIAGLQVTAPLRTVLDLARVSEQFDDHTRSVTSALIIDHQISWNDCESRLNANRRLPHRNRALARIGAIMEHAVPVPAHQPSVTR
ncbi:type IV toxin-antitoxin system AbiEi family antitoxin [Homoserinimonas sp. OAct 916]|uniref:type IV toxin-antitoxin system AbiEi family antitoxin n=1 Tax=Homoserinimonas sp. OAct 916 TaxID=2211450 RepID=UPI000DBE100D|nr:type IV toxin-antitoxin system AbiEi family antitoxin [Homoserinimonas sp. OAct 916]